MGLVVSSASDTNTKLLKDQETLCEEDEEKKDKKTNKSRKKSNFKNAEVQTITINVTAPERQDAKWAFFILNRYI